MAGVARMRTERRPNLFLVGAQKSGTTSLALMLGGHPQVFMSNPKEPGYLAFGAEGYRFLDGRGRECRAASWVVHSENDYLDLFRAAPPEVQVLGEASTWYLAEPGMAERLQSFSPDARVVVILRQPAERAYSCWCHARRDQEEPIADFREALAAEYVRCEPSHLLRYREMSRYLEPLKEYLRVFGRERVLILLYEDLRGDRDALWRHCCEFLKVDAGLARPLLQHHNRSGMPRSRFIHGLMQSRRIKDFLRRLLPMSLTSRAKGLAEAANLQRMPPMDPALRAELNAEFAAEIRVLAALTGRNLDHWLRP